MLFPVSNILEKLLCTTSSGVSKDFALGVSLCIWFCGTGPWFNFDVVFFFCFFVCVTPGPPD